MFCQIFLISCYEGDITRIILNLMLGCVLVSLVSEERLVVAVVSMVVNIWFHKLWGIYRASKSLSVPQRGYSLMELFCFCVNV